MTRFQYLEDAKRENERNFRHKLHQSFSRFLAYCGVMRACRPVPQFKRQKPVVIGLVLPEGADIDVYEGGARYAAHGPSVLHGGHDGTEVLTRTANRKKLDDEGLSKALTVQRRVVLLAENSACVPESFHLAADAVGQVGPVLPRHVIAGAKLCLGLSVTPEQAEFIATVPLDIVAAALRRGRPVTKAIALMKEALLPKLRDLSGPTLDDLHGLGEAGDWGRELAVDLADWKAGKIGWEDVDRGILLSGPPGTGKTTFAGALARTCDVHLVLGSIGRWQARGHLGDLLKAMRAAFDEARKNAPSIIFLDEIDAVGDRERFSGHNAQYSTEVVAALLECIDGTERREGVVVVGACNHPERLDAALVRAGRLDRHVRIPLPDQKGREGILRWHLQGLLPGAELSAIAARTDGWNGASLEQLVRQGRRRARRARRDLTLDDLVAELPVRVAIPEDVRRRSALHEAGHAVVGLVLDAGELIAATLASTIVPNVAGLQDGGGVFFRQKPMRERTRSQLLDDICVRLGGLAAEEVTLGDRSAGGGGARGSDLHDATRSALTFEASYGLGEGFAYLASEDEDELFSALRLDRCLHARVDKVLAEQFARAKRIVESHRHEVERIAEALIAQDTLSAEEVRDLMAQQPRLRLIDDPGRKAS
ncbi:AAA family ATPase [Allomesorhizobium camelthorni]|uniref:AAA family ATPase n=1 Tax=Allomesorhizobium camelthorni TaxID=475069 RepID=A0A6G4WKC2_9HYPH|nr:AAA family ATPase [Mesorhizobium camelthorni]NGO54560.1 AAA family ATPase [Mesorhizobium camelthorni]